MSYSLKISEHFLSNSKDFEELFEYGIVLIKDYIKDKEAISILRMIKYIKNEINEMHIDKYNIPDFKMFCDLLLYSGCIDKIEPPGSIFQTYYVNSKINFINNAEDIWILIKYMNIDKFILKKKYDIL